MTSSKSRVEGGPFGLLWRLSALAVLMAFPVFAEARAPEAAIVVGDSAQPLERFAAEELKTYIKVLFDLDAPIGGEAAEGGLTFRVGVAEEVQNDQGVLLRPEGNTLLIAGGSPVAVLWAVYELVERWGVRYLVHEDVLPEDPGRLRLPGSEVRLEPNMRIRCWRLINDLAHGPVSWSLEENRRFLRQIAKMKYNRVYISFWPAQPFVHYSFRGVEKPPGFLFFGERFPIDEDTVGREKFHGMTEFTNPEFVGASPEEVVERAVGLAHGILREAKTLGMETGMMIQPFQWPREFMKVIPGSQLGRQLANPAEPGDDQSMDDPVLRDMIATVFRAYVETYPDAEYVYLAMPEHRGWTEQAEQAYDELDAKYRISELGTYEELCGRARARTSFPGGGERVERMLKGDLAAIAFFDSLVHEKDLLRRPDGRNDAKLIYCFVVEELFPLLAKMLPPGGGLLSFIDYTASRQLRQRELFRQSLPRSVSRTMTFTLADDNVGVLPQLATGSLHEVMKELRANGWSGFCTRYWTVGDLDPTVHYLSRASWDPSVTPEAAYEDLVKQVCGPASVEPALKAFRIIEDITKGLDEHGLGFGFPVPGMMTKHYDSGGLSGAIRVDHASYREALRLMRAARESSAPSGHRFLDYHVGRLTFAVKYLDAAENFGATAKAKKEDNHEEAAHSIKQACQDIREALTAWADVAGDHGDLGAIALMNKYCYRPIRDMRKELAGSEQ